MADKHTPGEWNLGKENSRGFPIKAGGECIAYVFGPDRYANGLLLKSVPDMLEALDRILSLTPEDSQVHKIAEFAVRQAR